MAKEISDALNESHTLAQSAHKKQASEHRKSLNALEQKEDTAYDLLEEGTIDKNYLNRLRGLLL